MLPKKAVQDLVNAYKCFIESDEHNEGLGVGGGGGGLRI